jgi:hypothetical protein
MGACSSSANMRGQAASRPGNSCLPLPAATACPPAPAGGAATCIQRTTESAQAVRGPYTSGLPFSSKAFLKADSTCAV